MPGFELLHVETKRERLERLIIREFGADLKRWNLFLGVKDVGCARGAYVCWSGREGGGIVMVDRLCPVEQIRAQLRKDLAYLEERFGAVGS